MTFEGLASGVDHFVVLGDFSRNLWHEANRASGAEAVRSDGTTDLRTPSRQAGVLTRNLFLEVNDAEPASSTAELLSHCPGDGAIQAACDASKTRRLLSTELQLLAGKTGLGCRNPVGLDQILVSKSLTGAVRSVAKVAIGSFGDSLPPKPPTYPNPLLAVSDHCPTVVEIAF